MKISNEKSLYMIFYNILKEKFMEKILTLTQKTFSPMTNRIEDLFELSETYEGVGLNHYIPLTIRLLKEYKEGFDYRFVEEKLEQEI
ncbi:hypothetical protein BpHYR1_008304 [Brachionus plicatilis]|uniref:Uncharacterized protein n=1 Tax=Brachionus plicatilis TaxID=10195 RepID=A0A3M7RZ02_BRAPC|nr:hypothetical protein BpHYR1_008304 [Brachionus plicatilis]